MRPGSPWRQRLRWACGVCPAVDRFRVSLPATGVDTTCQTRISRRADHGLGQILGAATGRWPTTGSGEIPGQGGLTWLGVEVALRKGLGGLYGRTTLLGFLTGKQRGYHNTPLTEEQILTWADAHHHRTGRWPNADSGPVLDAPGETWLGIASALIRGCRSLPRGLSLSLLLIKHRGIRSVAYLPPLSIPEILAWADAHHARTGRWPDHRAGPIPESPDESWRKVQSALVYGRRGLSGGSSLARLLSERRGLRNPQRPPDLSVPEILAWADAFRAHGLLAEANIRTHPRGPGRDVVQRGTRPPNGRSRFPRRVTTQPVPPPASRLAISLAPAHIDGSADPGLGRRISCAHRPVAESGVRPHPRGPGRNLEHRP